MHLQAITAALLKLTPVISPPASLLFYLIMAESLALTLFLRRMCHIHSLSSNY